MNCRKNEHLCLFLSLQLEGVETSKYCCVCRPPFGKVLYSSNDHGRTRKCDFCISICKTNLADNHIFMRSWNTIHNFRDSVLVCKMYDFMIRKNFEHFHSFPLSDASDYNE